jgi:hypothetical protein
MSHLITAGLQQRIREELAARKWSALRLAQEINASQPSVSKLLSKEAIGKGSRLLPRIYTAFGWEEKNETEGHLHAWNADGTVLHDANPALFERVQSIVRKLGRSEMDRKQGLKELSEILES